MNGIQKSLGVLALVFATLSGWATEPAHCHDFLVGIDSYGRSFESISSLRKDKQVGIFFWLWIGQPYASGVYDATQILNRPGGADLLFHQDDQALSPAGQAHFWGEPLWGYYNSQDEWVLRKQLQLLTQAGVDFIVFDATNSLTYPNVYMKLLSLIDEYQKAGWNPPKVAFYTHSLSLQTTRRLYQELYQPQHYPETWYRVKGRPFIIAYTNVKDDLAEAQSRGDKAYQPEPLSQEILDFFHFRKPQWPFDPVYPEGFPWIEWHFPQPLHTDTMSVTVASHPSVPFSFTLTRQLENWGRGWDPELKKNISTNVDRGTFFQRQWDHALSVNPDTLFVGGWNEWIAYKQIYDGEYMLCDAVNKEFSRDIEPMKEGYEDAFYIQLIQNIRKYKGLPRQKTKTPRKTIHIEKSPTQWESVAYSCRNMELQAHARDSFGVSQQIQYQQKASPHQIKEVKVAHDARSLYFYIAWEGDSAFHPQLLIGRGSASLKNWESYEYQVAGPAQSRELAISKLSADYSLTPCGHASSRVQGNVMQIRIPRRAIDCGKKVDRLYFKVAVDVENPSDIMNTYQTGSVLPMGRLSYQYFLD